MKTLQKQLSIEAARKIHPNATTMALVWDGLAGAKPFLAPGILAFIVILVLAATYYHPGLTKQSVTVL